MLAGAGWPFSQDMLRDTILSIDENLGAASQSSIDRLATKVDGLGFAVVISTAFYGFTLWKLHNDLTPIANEFRRTLLAQAFTQRSRFPARGGGRHPHCPPRRPRPWSFREGSVSLGRYGQRVLAVTYNLNGVTHQWPFELPAGKVFADDAKLRVTFEHPSECKDSPSKSCRFIVKKPKLIDDPSYNAGARSGASGVFCAGAACEEREPAGGQGSGTSPQ